MLDVQGADTKIWEESLEADIKMLEGDGGNTGNTGNTLPIFGSKLPGSLGALRGHDRRL